MLSVKPCTFVLHHVEYSWQSYLDLRCVKLSLLAGRWTICTTKSFCRGYFLVEAWLRRARVICGIHSSYKMAHAGAVDECTATPDVTIMTSKQAV